MKQTWLLGLSILLTVFLTGCESEVVQSDFAPGKKLHQMTITTDEPTTRTLTFSYDPEGKLASVIGDDGTYFFVVRWTDDRIIVRQNYVVFDSGTYDIALENGVIVGIRNLYSSRTTHVDTDAENRVLLSYAEKGGSILPEFGDTLRWENDRIVGLKNYSLSHFLYHENIPCIRPTIEIDRIYGSIYSVIGYLLYAHPQLAGKAPGNALKEIHTEYNNNTSSYEYQMDADGYPIRIDLTERGGHFEYKHNYVLTWQ